MEIVPYTTSGNVNTGNVISVHLLGISEYLKCSFSSCVSDTELVF